MKQYLFILLFGLFCITQTTAQADFDYTFYPAPKYGKYLERFIPDTIKTPVRPTRVTAIVDGMGNVDSVGRKLEVDSSALDIQVVVEKTGDRLTVRDVSTLSLYIFNEQVEFVGMLNDGVGSLAYRQKTGDPDQVIVVNPVQGFVVISFRKCFTEDNKLIEGDPYTLELEGKTPKPDFCNFVNHYFGKVALGAYRP